MDFIIKNNHDREKRSIKINHNDKIRILYIRKLNTSLAIRLSEIFDKMQELQEKDEKDIKTIREIYNYFIQFLKMTIENFNEVEDVIFDLPVEETFMKKFIEKIQEKMLISEMSESEEVKKKTRRYTKKKLR